MHPARILWDGQRDIITSVKTLGVIGGLGPETTVDYYRYLFAIYRERQPTGPAPRIIINSLDVDYGLGLIAAGRLDDVTAYLVSGIQRLDQAGAVFAILA